MGLIHILTHLLVKPKTGCAGTGTQRAVSLPALILTRKTDRIRHMSQSFQDKDGRDEEEGASNNPPDKDPPLTLTFGADNTWPPTVGPMAIALECRQTSQPLTPNTVGRFVTLGLRNLRSIVTHILFPYYLAVSSGRLKNLRILRHAASSSKPFRR